MILGAALLCVRRRLREGVGAGVGICAGAIDTGWGCAGRRRLTRYTSDEVSSYEVADGVAGSATMYDRAGLPRGES